MAGSNKQVEIRLLLFMLGIAVLAGCGSSKESGKTGSGSAAEDMRRYEEEFRPSEYDPDVTTIFSELRNEEKNADPNAGLAPVDPPVLMQGYRVQILETSLIDEANMTKAQAEAAFPDEWFYIAYDPPTYKVRVGNFHNRADAQLYARKLAENGYADAWIVPDKIIKNAPPRPSSTPQDQHR